MICVKVFKILVSVLELVTKSHVPVNNSSAAPRHGTWDLETTSKTLSRILNITSQPIQRLANLKAI